MGAWGEGSLREKRPGVFEIRVAVGSTQSPAGPSSAPSGSTERWRTPRSDAGSWPPSSPSTIRRAAPFLTVGELLERWVCAQHDWRPSTWVGVRSNVKALSADPIAGQRVATLRPEVVRVTMA
jgi:hypothetical protein